METCLQGTGASLLGSFLFPSWSFPGFCDGAHFPGLPSSSVASETSLNRPSSGPGLGSGWLAHQTWPRPPHSERAHSSAMDSPVSAAAGRDLGSHSHGRVPVAGPHPARQKGLLQPLWGQLPREGTCTSLVERGMSTEEPCMWEPVSWLGSAKLLKEVL